MEGQLFNKLLLKTAFSCMACDGHIDPREVELIKQLHQERQIFGDIEITSQLDALLTEINKDGHLFLKSYLKDLSSSDLTEANELKLIEVTIETIKADDKVEYSEIKFFKVIRSKLKIANEPILEKHPDFEDYLEQDIISESYLSRLQDDFFETQTIPELTIYQDLNEDILKNSSD